MRTIPVAMFAYNEERKIRPAVESVLRSFQGQAEFEPLIYVIVNGSSDRTAEIVRDLASQHPSVRLVEISFPDKCNAWNEYVFSIAPRAEAHVFMDGDCLMDVGAGPELVRCLLAAPDAFAAVGMPTGGRMAKQYREGLIANPTVYGNLYALRDEALRMFRDRNVRLPLGTIGDDGLIGFLIARDLDPTAPAKRERVIAAERVAVLYTPMPWYVPHYMYKYYRRRINFSVRFYQFQLLGPRLESRGISALPKRIVEIYEDMDHYKRPLRGGLDLISDPIAWRRMKRMRKAQSQQRQSEGSPATEEG